MQICKMFKMFCEPQVYARLARVQTALTYFRLFVQQVEELVRPRRVHRYRRHVAHGHRQRGKGTLDDARIKEIVCSSQRGPFCRDVARQHVGTSRVQNGLKCAFGSVEDLLHEVRLQLSCLLAKHAAILQFRFRYKPF